MYRALTLAMLLLCTLAAAPSYALSTVDAGDPVVLRDIVAQRGSAILMVDGFGDPLIEGRIDGQKFSVLFYDCKSGANCGRVSFRRSWTVPGLTLERVNDWNSARLVGVAALKEDGVATIGLDVNLAHGVTAGNFAATVADWRQIMSEFSAFVRLNDI